MTQDDAERVLSDFYHGRKNQVGDYWGRDAIKEAIETLLGRKLKGEKP